jgi:uncharacterized protein YbjQ (UPF0145 family)
MKNFTILLLIVSIIGLAACASNDYTASLAGAADNSTIAVKDFVTLGIITVRSTEIHQSGPFGFSKSVQGSKITFADLLQEAVKLEADDVINVRIDINTSYSKTAFDWLTGWTRTFSYTGTALAIKYTEKVDTEIADPQLSSLPKTPENSGAVKVTKSGKVVLR